MRKLFHKGIKLWESEISLRIFFVSILILNFILTPISSSHESGAFVARIFYFFLIISGAYALIKNKAFVYSVIAFSMAAFVVWLVSNGNNIIWLNVLDGFSQVLFYLIFLFLILVKVFKDGIFSFQKLEGAITGYLLIGNMFASLYFTMNVIYGAQTFHMPGDMHIASFTYFSYTTLTTMGYGDIIPIHPFARSMSNLEAVIGQLYPAILIARLLSMESFRSSKS